MSELTHGSLFSGIGGFELGAEWAGIKTLWNCEIEEFQRSILKKHFPNAKQYTDIKELKNPEYVDIISGGFPCQDISIANTKATGIGGKRSGLWKEYFRIIRDIRPKYILAENSPMLINRGLEHVLCDLSKIGYNVEWQCLSATSFGLQHRRERVYIIAYSNKIKQLGTINGTECEKIFRKPYLPGQPKRISPGWRNRRDLPEPRTFRNADDIPNLVDRIASLGNAVIPQIAQYLFECIKQHYDRH